MIEALVLPIAGFFDRVRGGWPKGRSKWVKYPCMYSIGALLALQVTHTWYLVLIAGVMFAQGWRQDNGWRGQWVAGIHRWDLAFRFGALLPIFVLPFGYLEPKLLLFWPACILGAPAGMWAATILPAKPDFLDLRHAWPWSELITMPIIGLLLILGDTIWARTSS